MDDAGIATVETGEVARAASVVARAFHDDPLTVHLYPDEAARPRSATLMFEAIVRYDSLYGQVDHLPDLAGVATWLPPNAEGQTPERLAAAGFGGLHGDIPLERLDSFFTSIEPWHARAAPDAHWYLDLLAVVPSRQGAGRGSRLLEHGLARSERTGHPCFLWTFSERNAPFYLRHGFELTVDEIEPATGIHVMGFHRAPRRRVDRLTA